MLLGFVFTSHFDSFAFLVEELAFAVDSVVLDRLVGIRRPERRCRLFGDGFCSSVRVGPLGSVIGGFTTMGGIFLGQKLFAAALFVATPGTTLIAAAAGVPSTPGPGGSVGIANSGTGHTVGGVGGRDVRDERRARWKLWQIGRGRRLVPNGNGFTDGPSRSIILGGSRSVGVVRVGVSRTTVGSGEKGGKAFGRVVLGERMSGMVGRGR